MNFNRNIGLHYSIRESYSEVALRAYSAEANIFQLFPIAEKQQKHFPVLKEDLSDFLDLRKNFNDIYIHSSFKINLATEIAKQKEISSYIFRKEIDIANKLEASYIVMHPGHATKRSKVSSSIKRLIDTLESILSTENNVKLLLENVAHGKNAIGNNLDHFSIMRKMISKTEKIKFCVDLSHAFSYGYNIANTEDFIQTLDATMGIENIRLIHLNDTNERKGSRIDAHLPPGHGKIGKSTLQKLINHPKLKTIPIIIELPINKEYDEKAILDEVKTW
ncbi:deoxyribonuclease IV [Candidatus Babeliales bacterium]|nr:deoxyribonuclease IV [Candidatus Babeliales bacterium]